MLSRYLLAESGGELRLMYHRRELPADLRSHTRAKAFPCDLARPETLTAALQGADCVIHFAGVLFKAGPERFLPTTNTVYFRNLLETALRAGVRRVILVSFPHVEGTTTAVHPATGRLDGTPDSMHAKTRLEEERLLFEAAKTHAIEAISLRVGMVYGRGVLMPDVARWLAQRRLLGVWNDPTWIHLISKDDFLAATANAITRPGAQGIYHLGDEGQQTLQEFLDTCSEAWGTAKPWRMPLWLIYFAAQLCEFQSRLFGTRAPLTRDFITIGRCSYYGDTSRMRAELLSKLKYRTIAEGRLIL
jgi:nucleoside-diphosphate-sugar epimerase